eukprot:6206588-Pleurochrysis_carterae.AAC.2
MDSALASLSPRRIQDNSEPSKSLALHLATLCLIASSQSNDLQPNRVVSVLPFATSTSLRAGSIRFHFSLFSLSFIVV